MVEMMLLIGCRCSLGVAGHPVQHRQALPVAQPLRSCCCCLCLPPAAPDLVTLPGPIHVTSSPSLPIAFSLSSQ